MEVRFDIVVVCKDCGNDLEAAQSYSRGKEQLSVEVCKYCLDKGKSEGYDRGYSDRDKEG